MAQAKELAELGSVITVDNGNIGIGTSSPSSKLTVNGSIQATGGDLYLKRAGANDAALYFGSNTDCYIYSGNSTQIMAFATASLERVRIDGSGNVGVGVSSMSQKLVVGGSAYTRVQVNGSTNGGIYFTQNGVDGGTITGSTTAIQVYAPGYGEAMRVNSNGSLTVGTSAANTGPANTSALYGYRVSSIAWLMQNNATTNGYVLELLSGSGASSAWNFVDGYDSIFGTPTMKFKIDGNGSMYNGTGTYGTLSDIKLKENIVDATPKLDKVMQLQVKNFNFINTPELKQIGFIAQEFEQVFPSLIEETEDKDQDKNPTGGTTKAIKTAVLIPILVKAIQELKAEVDALKAKSN